MAANGAAFDSWQIVPRVLNDVESRDLSVELFGRKLPTPILLSPIGVLDLAHRDADLAVARAASAYRVPFIFSNQASVEMERCAREMGHAPRWFQLYWNRSDAVVASFVQRAERCGCSAIVVTLDTTMLGWRPRDLDLGSLPFLHGRGMAQYTTDPVFREELRGEDTDAPGQPGPPITLRSLMAALEQKKRFPGGLLRNMASREPRRAVRKFLAQYSRPSLRWEELAFLRRHTRLPLLLKGILHPDDARKAASLGMDGIIVSNHGGRQIDGEVASLDALPAVVDAVSGKLPVLFDSGIRSGADVFKALALGATAVCLGRPYVYGLAVAGERGVREVITNVLAELDLTLGLAGRTSVRGLDARALVRSPRENQRSPSAPTR